MLRELRGLFADAARSYARRGGRMLASAVAFSSLLSIAPLLYIALSVADVAVGDVRSRTSVLSDLSRWIGEDGAGTIISLLDRAREHGASGATHVLGVLLLVYASTRLFSQIKYALDHLWDIHPRSGRGFRAKGMRQLRKRGLSLVLVLLVGVLIIAGVAVKTVLVASTALLDDASAEVVIRGGEALLSLATSTLMFAGLFKLLPDARLDWRDALRGAFVTAMLFSLGTTLIALYLGHKTLDVLYGPGGSLVLLLLWVHYSAQVFFLGAAVTGELARRRGRPIEPDAYGVRIVLPDVSG